MQDAERELISATAGEGSEVDYDMSVLYLASYHKPKEDLPTKEEHTVRAQRILSWVLIGLMIGLCSAGNGLAQEQKEQEGGENLAQQARNPTASLTMLQILVEHVPKFHNLEDTDMTRILVMPVVPFKFGKTRHIARITLPYVAAGPDWGTLVLEEQTTALPPNYTPTDDKTGLGDMALFDVIVFDAPWKGGQYFGGISAILPTATDPALGTEKWSLGPAGGALVQSGKLLLGGLILTNFSVTGSDDRDDVSAMSLQAFGSYGLGKGWSLELPLMMYNYDFNNSMWTSVPLGVRVGKFTQFGKLPVRFFADAEYNFADKSVAPEWTLRFAVVPLI